MRLFSGARVYSTSVYLRPVLTTDHKSKCSTIKLMSREIKINHSTLQMARFKPKSNVQTQFIVTQQFKE